VRRALPKDSAGTGRNRVKSGAVETVHTAQGTGFSNQPSSSLSHRLEKRPSCELRLDGDSMQVSEVLVRNVEIAAPDTPLLELAQRMRENAIGFMPLVEGERLVGVITDRDIS
jgi:CBS-domain-containing membrane protein